MRNPQELPMPKPEKLQLLQVALAEQQNAILLPTNSCNDNWKRINISVAATMTPPPQKYIIGHLPEEPGIYGLIIGPDGSRKSWLALHLAISKASGTPVAGGLWPAPETAGRVVYVTTEDSANILWRRIFSIAAQPGNEFIQTLGDNLDVLPIPEITLIKQTPEGPQIEDELLDLIEFCKGASLIILDPLAELADSEESDDRAARKLVQAFKKLSRETGAGLLVVHHQNKDSMLKGGTSHQTGRGSSRYGAQSRWAIVLQPLSEKEANSEWITSETDKSRWTMIHESKSSYSNKNEVKSMYHYPDWMNNNGDITPGVPLARDIKKEDIDYGTTTATATATTKSNGNNGYTKAKQGEESDDLDQLMGL
jgi:RecA-family ATPase